MNKSRSEIQVIFINTMLFIILVSIGLWAAVWIHGEYSLFKTESEALRRDYINTSRSMLKKQVTNVVKLVNDIRKNAEHEFKNALIKRVDEACDIAMNIYLCNAGTSDPKHIETMIKDALRPVRFNDRTGYYFAVSMKGVGKLFPLAPELEECDLTGFKDAKGRAVIQDEIRLAKHEGHGFIKQFVQEQVNGSRKIRTRILFVKYFRPLDWYIGAGIYPDYAENQIKQNIIKYLVNLRFKPDGYFFASTWDGHPLFSNGKITQGSGNIWELTDPKGVKIIQEQVKAAENPDGGFVAYSWKKLNGSQPSPKISFVMGIAEWRWTIGAGVYLDTIENQIEKNREMLFAELRNNTIHIALGLVFILCLVLWRSRRVAEKIRKGEEKYRSIFEKAVEGFFQSTPDGRFIAVNPAFAKMHGYDSPEELISNVSNIEDKFYHDPEDRKKYLEILEHNGYVEKFECRFLRRDGSSLFASVSARAVQDADGRIVRIEGSVMDISGRKKAEKQLKRFEIAMEQSPVAIVMTDIHANIEYVNPTFCRLTGYSENEVLGKKPNILKSGKVPVSTYRQLWQTILDGRKWHGEFYNKRKNGSFYWEDAIISPIVDENGEITHFMAFKEDISMRKEIEARLNQAQKMEAIGTLAGGIAHDFNNILFPIIGHAEMLLEDFAENTSVKESLNEIYTSALRAKELVKQILTFSRQEKNELHLFRIQPVVKEALKLIRSTIPATIEINQDINNECGPVKADPTQIHQIIMNLATNAFHAMEETGGKLTITLDEVKFDHLDILRLEMRPGTYICLCVTDTGTGMPADIVDKIFDPFFTTKPKGKGTGMGLSVVHGIVMKMNGDIRVYSEPGKGTRFSVYLPVEKGSAAESGKAHHSGIQGGNEHVLLVDDEKSVVEMESQMLERLGYQVSSRTSAIEALKFFQTDPYRFDLVITDMAMPEMSGDRLASAIVDIRSDIPVLLCTGFSDILSPDRAQAMGIRAVLLKPIVISELAAKIREILDGPGANQNNDDGR